MMPDAPGGTPPATPDNVVEKLAATFTMEYLTGHYRLLRDDEQRSFDQLRVIMLAFFAASCKALRAEVAQMTQERDKWLHNFNASEQYQSGPTKRAEAAEASLAALTAALEGLERDIRFGVGDDLAAPADQVRSWADRLAALRTPHEK